MNISRNIDEGTGEPTLTVSAIAVGQLVLRLGYAIYEPSVIEAGRDLLKRYGVTEDGPFIGTPPIPGTSRGRPQTQQDSLAGTPWAGPAPRGEEPEPDEAGFLDRIGEALVASGYRGVFDFAFRGKDIDWVWSADLAEEGLEWLVPPPGPMPH